MIRCLQEESKLVGGVKACFLVPCILGVLNTRKSIIRLFSLGCIIVVVYWCVFAGILGLVRCILRVILKIIVLVLCIDISVMYKRIYTYVQFLCGSIIIKRCCYCAFETVGS